MRKKTQLVLSTWFYKYLMDQKPAGLPNEIFTKSPHTLLLFDEIICDKYAFGAEKTFAKELGWTASEYFVKLKKEKIIKIVDTEKELASYLESFNEKEKGDIIDSQKQITNFYIKNNNLKDLNNHWSETPFGNFDKLCLNNLSKKEGYLTYNWEYGNLDTDNIILRSRGRECLSLLIPSIEFIPSFESVKKIDAKAYKSFRNLQKNEEIPLVEYKIGELSQEDWRDWRFQFRETDEKIDEILKDKAKYNFDILMKMRKETSTLRTEVGEFLADLQNKTENDVDAFSYKLNKELNEQIEDLAKEREEEMKMIMGRLFIHGGLTYIANLINPLAAIISLVGGIDSMHSKVKQFEDGLDKKYPLARYKNKLEMFESIRSNINVVNELP